MPALETMRVLEFTQWEAGPSCAMMLAWLGADVVKVEPPGGEVARNMLGVGPGDSQYFLNYNANKRGLALDLKNPKGKELLSVRGRGEFQKFRGRERWSVWGWVRRFCARRIPN